MVLGPFGLSETEQGSVETLQGPGIVSFSKLKTL